MSSEEKIYVVLCSSPPGEAERLASFLVEKRYAACVNVVPGVTSVYRWQGKIERDAESLLVIKCPRRAAQPLCAALVKEHPYDVPEVVALPVEEGNAPYVRWVLDVAGGGPAQGMAGPRPVDGE